MTQKVARGATYTWDNTQTARGERAVENRSKLSRKNLKIDIGSSLHVDSTSNRRDVVTLADRKKIAHPARVRRSSDC